LLGLIAASLPLARLGKSLRSGFDSAFHLSKTV
jgi:hypothetical protein